MLKVVACLLATCALNFIPGDVSANGISDFEGVQCVGEVSDLGLDASVCADTELPDCQIPDWFPTYGIGVALGGSDEMNSTAGELNRYNEVNYAAGSYSHWRHSWYSDVDVPYGPALPSSGHVWNQYAGTTLIKSASCDSHGTYSYP